MATLPADSLLYCDTDSLIYTHKTGVDPISTGTMLGEWTDEQPGRRIIEFIGGGPKNYGYRHVDPMTGEDPKAFLKVKGFTLNYETSRILNFESVLHRIKAQFVTPATGYAFYTLSIFSAKFRNL
jgi:hypothetical protein